MKQMRIIPLIVLTGLLAACGGNAISSSSGEAPSSGPSSDSGSSGSGLEGLDLIESLFVKAYSLCNYSLHDSEYEEGHHDTWTKKSMWYDYQQRGFVQLEDRVYEYTLDDEGNLVKEGFRNDIDSIPSCLGALIDIANGFSSLGFSEVAGEGYYTSTLLSTRSAFMQLSSRSGEYASDVDSVDLKAEDDGITIVLRGLAGDGGADEAFDPTASDVYYRIYDIGTSVNGAVDSYIASYTGTGYDSYLPQGYIDDLKQAIKVSTMRSVSLDGIKEDDTMSVAVLSGGASSFTSYNPDDSIDSFSCYELGEDWISNERYLDYVGEVKTGSLGVEFLPNYSYGLFDILESRYFGTKDDGKTYELIDPCEDLVALLNRLTVSDLPAVSSFTITVQDGAISMIAYETPEFELGENTALVSGIMLFSERGTAVPDTISYRSPKTDITPLKIALLRLASQSYGVSFSRFDGEDDVSEGDYVIDREQNAFERTMNYYDEEKEAEVTQYYGRIYSATGYDAYSIYSDGESKSVVRIGKLEYDPEVGEITGEDLPALPSIALSASLFEKTAERTYTLADWGVLDGIASTLDPLTGYGEYYMSVNKGLTITLDESGDVSSFSYYYDASDGGFDTGKVTGTVSGVGTSSIGDYDLSSIHDPENWDEEGLYNNLIVEDLYRTYGDSYKDIPYIFGTFGEGEWGGFLLDADNSVYDLYVYLGEDGSTVDDFIDRVVNVYGYTENADYSGEEGYRQFVGDSFSLVIDSNDPTYIDMEVTPVA